MFARFVGFIMSVITWAFMPAQDADWVESSVWKLKQSDKYQSEARDGGWYETQPVAKWNYSGMSIVIRFGRSSRTKRPGFTIPVYVPRSPYLECEVSFPSGATRWSQVEESAFPVHDTEIPASADRRGDVMELRRAYYRALSLMLAAQSPLKRPEQITPRDCELVSNVQKTLFEAEFPSMSWYYEPASEPIRSWLSTHCHRSP